MKTNYYQIINSKTGEIIAWTDVDAAIDDEDIVEDRIMGAIDYEEIPFGDYHFKRIKKQDCFGIHL